jgi:hypothetical protein
VIGEVISRLTSSANATKKIAREPSQSFETNPEPSPLLLTSAPSRTRDQWEAKNDVLSLEQPNSLR